MNFPIAFAVSSLPILLYSSAFEMPLNSWALLYLLGTLGSTVLLGIAYTNTAASEVARFSDYRKGVFSGKHRDWNMDAKAMEALQMENTQTESNYYALFLNNLIWVLTFLSLSLYVLEAAPVALNYGISMGFASVLVWQLSVRFV